MEKLLRVGWFCKFPMRCDIPKVFDSKVDEDQKSLQWMYPTLTFLDTTGLWTLILIQQTS